MGDRISSSIQSMLRFFSSLFSIGLLAIFIAPPAFAQLGATGRGLDKAGATVDVVAEGSGFSTANVGGPVGVAGALVNTFLSLIGIVFIILIIYAGFKWMTAGGNEEQVNKAKTTIINSVIGIAVVMGAFVLYKFIEGIL